MKKIYSLLLILPFLMGTPGNAAPVVMAAGPAKVATVAPVKVKHAHKHHSHHHHLGYSTKTADHMNMCYRETKNPFCGSMVQMEKKPCLFGCFFKG